MAIKTNTYIVCNSGIVQKLRNIKDFKINLGQQLHDKQLKFNPVDLNIQKHYLFFNDIINMVGYIGSLAVYTKPTSLFDHIYLYNEKESFDYTIDNNMSLYDNINLALGLFFDKLGIKSNVVTKDEVFVDETVYVKPNKKLSEMNLAERIAYVRNNK